MILSPDVPTARKDFGQLPTTPRTHLVNEQKCARCSCGMEVVYILGTPLMSCPCDILLHMNFLRARSVALADDVQVSFVASELRS